MINDISLLVDELAGYCQQGRLVFLVGAGIDMHRRSNVPGWDAIRLEVLKIIGKEASPDKVGYIENYKGHLLNEVLLQLVSQTLPDSAGLDQATEIVRICVDTREFSNIHRFLAWSLQEFDNGLLTTNYNYLVDAAAELRMRELGARPIKADRIIRLHGEVNLPGTMRHRVDSVYAPLDAGIVARAGSLMKDKILLVAGYRGADEFDVLPLIFEQHRPMETIWTVHPSAKESEPEQLVADKLKRKPISIDVDHLLSEVYLRIVTSGGPVDSTLGRNWSLTDSGSVRDWKIALQDWGRREWSSRPNDMRFLWARIAEHVRAPFIEEAYTRFLEEGSDIYRRLFAASHIAYQLRTRDKTDLKRFQEVLAEIRVAIGRETNAPRTEIRNLLERLLAWTIHEYGIALQNNDRHLEAKFVLQEALLHRTLLGDPTVPYSIFQIMMNGFQASQKGLDINDFAPSGWRTWLSLELESHASSLRQSNSAEHHANTIHNRAFVHQAIALEFEHQGKVDEAQRNFLIAEELNRTAYNVRVRLRDPRMMAQSQVRICECTLGLARIEYSRKNYVSVRIRVDEARRLIKETEEIYKTVPQEDIRQRDVDRIRSEISRIEREFLDGL